MAVEKEDIVQYVQETPGNSNPAVLRSLLNQLDDSGEGATFKVEKEDEEKTYQSAYTGAEIDAAVAKASSKTPLYAHRTSFRTSLWGSNTLGMVWLSDRKTPFSKYASSEFEEYIKSHLAPGESIIPIAYIYNLNWLENTIESLACIKLNSSGTMIVFARNYMTIGIENGEIKCTGGSSENGSKATIWEIYDTVLYEVAKTE